MASTLRTLVGQSGRNYLIQKILKSTTNTKYDVSFASSDDGEYVLKPVSPAIWKQAENISHDLKSAQFIRLPIDFIPAESVLVYPYFTDHLLSFVQNYEIPLAQTKGILLSVLKALKELHGQDWVHTDVKFDNIVLEYKTDAEGQPQVGRVKLTDPESAAKVPERKYVTGFQAGNVMWRSPEAQAGIRIGKKSDVFSFGIVCINAVLPINIFGFESEKLEEGVLPEIEILERMMSYFGPVPEGLLEHINHNEWCNALITLSASFDKENPPRPFALWDEQYFPYLDSDFKRLVDRMMNLDPSKRATVNDLLNDPWWYS